MLMADKLTMEDRLGISEYVIDHREKLKILLAAAGSAMTSNPRRARSMSAAGTGSPFRTANPATETAVDRMAGVQNARKAEQYTKDTKKPNFHTAIHYSTMADEYSIPSNGQVLIGEDKHR